MTLRFLGHKQVENTMRYIQLEQMAFKDSGDYICETANGVEEAKELIETGFEYVCEFQDKSSLEGPNRQYPCGVVV